MDQRSRGLRWSMSLPWLAACVFVLGALSILLWEPIFGYALVAVGAALLIAAYASRGRGHAPTR